MTMPQEAVDQFLADATKDWSPLNDEELFQLGNFLRNVKLGPDAVQYTPGTVALLGAARRLYATAMIQRETIALAAKPPEVSDDDSHG